MGGYPPHEMLIFSMLFMGGVASSPETIEFASNLLKLGFFITSKLFLIKIRDRKLFSKKSVLSRLYQLNHGGGSPPP